MTPLPSASTSCHRQISFKPVLLLHAAIPKSSILHKLFEGWMSLLMPVLCRYNKINMFHLSATCRDELWVVWTPTSIICWRSGGISFKPAWHVWDQGGRTWWWHANSPASIYPKFPQKFPSEVFPQISRPSANLPWAQLVSAIRHLKTHLYRSAFHIGVEPWKDTMPRLG